KIGNFSTILLPGNDREGAFHERVRFGRSGALYVAATASLHNLEGGFPEIAQPNTVKRKKINVFH
ncbi:MAG: hypothetical protein MI807_20295, partial [Verrucomicrobiales bacterium]|nr:hypothetical protein [Verrucomicrobiales bacterium]